MKINIVYEVNNREFNNCLLIQRELIRRGHNAKIYNKCESLLLRDNSKSVTLIPNSYRNSDLDHYRYCFNSNGGIVIIYPCEQVTNHRMPAFFDYSDGNLVKSLPHLCWSKDYFDYIESLGFNNELSKIVGAVQLDYCRPEFSGFYVKRDYLSSKYNLPKNKKWMLFISDFVLDNEEKFNRLLNAGDVERNILELRREHERKSMIEILKWFECFLQNNKNYILIYRKHPVEILSETIVSFQKKFPDQVYCISELGIKDWIFNCERIVTWNSTSVVECYAANKNIHLLRPVPFDEENGLAEYPFYRVMEGITSYERFEEHIENDIWSYSSEVVSEINNLYSIEERPAFKRVADAIESISGHNSDIVHISGFRLGRFKYLFSRMIPVKVLIKKLLQRIYIISGFRFGNQAEKGAAINEWMATADNLKDMKRKSILLDDIINKFN